jgi:PhnB protein
MPPKSPVSEIKYSLAPWISVPVGGINFYKSAFGATEVYHHDGPSGGVVVRLSVNGAEFWLSQESPEHTSPASGPIGGGNVRLILTVSDPDALFARALKAGAKEVYPVSEGHGWRIGRIADPFGLHWEIGHPLTP